MTNEERAMELYNALKKCHCNVEIIKRISTHDDEIRRECNDEVYRQMLSKELTKAHDDEIRRECAERAWNYVALRATSQTFGMGLTKHDMESAIMGKEAGG